MDWGVIAQSSVEQIAQFKNRIHVLVSAPLLATAAFESDDIYVPVPPLGVWEEAEDIRHILAQGGPKFALDLDVSVATHDELLETLTTPIPSLVLHFAGHGEPRRIGMALIVEDDHGIAVDFSAETMAEYLGLRKGPPCAVAVLNACYSQRLAEAFKDAGVPHIIAIAANQTVLDEASRKFSRIFYPTLLKTGDVRTAFSNARVAVKTYFEQRRYGAMDPTGALFESLKFVYEQGPGAGIALQFDGKNGEIVSSPRSPTNLMPVSPDPFIGRQRVLNAIATALDEPDTPRLIQLKAIGGMGKTATALAAGRWHHERAKFTDGVWQLMLRSVGSTDQVWTELIQLLYPGGAPLTFNDFITLLKDKRHLFILDDLDALLQHDRDGVIACLKLLLGLPYCRVIATSREALPEEIYCRTIAIEQFDRNEAIEVFRKYAGDENVNLRDDVERIAFNLVMDFLDGYAFPIRLAAAYLKRRAASFVDLNDQLRRAPQRTLQTPFAPTSRETSLFATLEISYSVLSKSAQDALAILAQFPGGLTVRTARRVEIHRPEDAFAELRHFSMAEFTDSAMQWRAQLPEPARQFVLSKSPPGISDIAVPRFIKYLRSTFDGKSSTDPGLLMVEEKRNVYSALDYALRASDAAVRLSAGYVAVRLASYWQGIGKSEAPKGADYLLAALESAQAAGENLLVAEASLALAEYDVLFSEDERAVGRYNVAISAFSALSLHSRSGSTRESCANALLRLGRTVEAVAACASAAKDFELAKEPVSQARLLIRQAGILKRAAGSAVDAIAPLKLACEVLVSADPIMSARAAYDAAMIELANRRDEDGVLTLQRAMEVCPIQAVDMLDSIVAALMRNLTDHRLRASTLSVQAESMRLRGRIEASSLLHEEAGDEFTDAPGEAAAHYQRAFDVLEDLESGARDRIAGKLIDAKTGIQHPSQ